jgi:hypothetical protein
VKKSNSSVKKSNFSVKKDYFFDKKKCTTFFHARISRSGKGPTPSTLTLVAEKVRHEAPTAGGKKYLIKIDKIIFLKTSDENQKKMSNS